jgi:pimeloyl-ACP methyl ester carboxylesterase
LSSLIRQAFRIDVVMVRKGSPRMPREYADHAYATFRRPAKRMVLRWYRAMPETAYEGWDRKLVDATATVPKLVVWGDRDPFLPTSMAERFGGAVRHVADGGHHVMVEDPDLAAAAIAEQVARGESLTSQACDPAV